MKKYFVAIPDTVSENSIFNVNTGSSQFIIEAKFDTDPISDTYSHWVLVVNRIVGDDTEERCIVVNPNCNYFPSDEVYSVVTVYDGEAVGLNDLSKVTLVFVVREEDE
jgi:hypothetical protein